MARPFVGAGVDVFRGDLLAGGVASHANPPTRLALAAATLAASRAPRQAWRRRRPLLSLAAITALAWAAAGAARATEAPTVGEVVVTGLPEPKGDAAYDIVEIGPARLAASASGRAEDVLRDVAGFQQFRRADSRAANPTSQGATLRALGGNAASRALVLLDGAPLADPFSGYIPWSAIDPERLAAVRVTRGAGVGAFGAGALAGTIELSSAEPAAPPPLRAGLAVGSRGSVDADAQAGGPAGDGGLTLFGHYDRGDGYFLVPAFQRGPVDIPASYRQASVGARAVSPLGGAVRLALDVLAFDDERVQGLAGTTSEVDGADASARVVGDAPWPFEALAYLQLMNFANTVAAVDPTRAIQTPSLDEFDTPAIGWGGKIEVRPPVGDAVQLRLGLDLRDADGHTNELSHFLTGAFTQRLAAGGHERVAGAFAEASVTPTRRLTLTAGGRLDAWSIDGGELIETNIETGAPIDAEHPPDRSHVEPTARGGAAWEIAPALRLRAAAYLGYRLPTLNELYRPFRVGLDATAANPALQPERLRGAEAGLDFAPAPGARLSLTVFDNRLADAIANITLGFGPGVFPQVGFVAAGGAFRQRGNVDAIEARGVEAEAHLARGPWRLDASYAYAHSRVEASGAAAALNGLPPAETPAHQASATLGWVPVRGALLAVTGRYASGQNDDDLGLRRLTGAATLDAVAEIPAGRGVTLVLRGENLTNAEIESGLAANGLITLATPRTLWAGVRLAL
ncbi:MAG: TonB-dependent receptor [Caulobacteraceae bacterium]